MDSRQIKQRREASPRVGNYRNQQTARLSRLAREADLNG